MTTETDERGQPYTKPHIGKSLLEKMWDELDRLIDVIKAQPTETMVEQARARGVAWAISLCATPYFDQETAVLRQAERRWKMRNDLMEWEPTPSYRYNPPPAGSKYYENERRTFNNKSAPSSPAKKRAPRKSPTLNPADIKGIKDAVESGMFDKQTIAGIFKVSVAQVEAALKS